MSGKTASVTARIQPEIKEQAEAILDKLGVPVSVLIDTLYRQIIMTKSIPYSFNIPKILSEDDMTDGEFDLMMKKGLDMAKAGKGLNVDEAFARINQKI
ncbi:MAG: type II toxin-antitoxin system RelB/DinJ family antitoxin [Ruminiclostridium sp.]|nr:type II toxin-antitoxin system RelB/DinJ family antitoxin [Ruminiclostridium sp.]